MVTGFGDFRQGRPELCAAVEEHIVGPALRGRTADGANAPGVVLDRSECRQGGDRSPPPGLGTKPRGDITSAPLRAFGEFAKAG